MACARDERHRYGQHYTPRSVARLLAAFAIRDARDRVFDPGCGDGRLLESSLDRKLELDCQHWNRDRLAEDLFGIDRSIEAISPLHELYRQTSRADFFEWSPEGQWPSSFDAIIGNPPYIRQEVIGALDKARIARLIAASRERSPGLFWPEFSGRSDIYVFFFAHAINFLREGGRLVFLTSASWLDSVYGAALREFMTANFKVRAIIESAVESFFDDASINTVISVLERCADHRERRSNRVRFIQLHQLVPENVSSLAEKIVETKGSSECSQFRARLINQTDLDPRSGWGKYLRAREVFFEVVDRGPALKPLSAVARVRFGVKTGANDFFYLESQVLNQRRASLRSLGEVAAVRRGLTTGANEFFYLKGSSGGHANTITVEDAKGQSHLIEPRYLKPVVFSLKQLPRIELRRPPDGKFFFHCHSSAEDLLGTHALDYIRRGERAGLHRRPTCSTRDPWYSVARGIKPAPLLFPSKVGERWLIAVNRARVFEDKKLYGVFPANGVNVKTLAALLNSTWARYYTEVTCRQMTGAQAIADIDVNVAEQLLIPDPRGLAEGLEDQLVDALDVIARRRMLSIFDEVKLPDRRRLDDLTFQAMGFNGQKERKKMIDQLYIAVMELVARRLAGSRSK